jgi:hypothetical protein
MLTINGVWNFSATWVACLVTLLWYVPIITDTPSFFISLSVSEAPCSGLPFVSPMTCSSLAPFRDLIPPVLFISSTAS